MAPPSSSSVSPSLPPRSHLFTPIQEGNESEETEERHRFGSATTPSTIASSSAGTTTSDTSTTTHHHHRRHHHHHHQHQRTPLHEPSKKTRKTPQTSSSSSTADDRSVSCTNCRPNTREKTSVVVVPVDNKNNHHHNHNHSLSSTSPSPNGLFKSLIAGISRRSPKPSPSPSPLPESSSASSEKEAILELSHKLVQATRRRDEAILEASKLKYSMSELEKKLNRLEIYCHNLKSGLDICNQAQALAQSPMRSSTSSWTTTTTTFPAPHNTDHDLIIKSFLSSVSDARSSIRFLSKSLCSQLKLMGLKVFERLSAVLKSYDFKLQPSSSSSTNSHANHNNHQYKSIQVYLEALLSAAFFEDFEGSRFVKNSTDHVLNPIDRCEVNYTAYSALKDLQWEEVLSKGTKHFSEEFSRYCDRKMSEIVSMLGWNRAWPEQLLQAFFGASKSVWLVHLLANSVHPRLSIFRVDKGVRFDPIYMDDMGGDKAKKLIPTMVRIMVAPGFYVFDNVVKCKVICRYYNGSDNYSVFSGSNGNGNGV